MSDYLGYVAWYSLPSNLIVHLDTLERFREEVDPLIKLPKKPSPVNLFKRVCKFYQAKISSDSEEKIFTIKDHIGLTKTIVEVDDSKNQTLVGYVDFKKGEDHPISFEYLHNSEYDAYWPHIQDEFLYMYSQQEYVDHMAVRSVIKNALEEKFQAVWLNSGTYFVEEEFLSSLKNVQEIVQSMGCEFEIIPLVDDGEQNFLVKKHLVRSLRSLLEEFYLQLYKLPYKASAYRVNKLEAMLSDMKAQLDRITFYNNQVVDDTSSTFVNEATVALSDKLDSWKS